MKLTAILCLSLLGFFSFALPSQPVPAKGLFKESQAQREDLSRDPRFILRLKDKLKLSPDQEEKIQARILESETTDIRLTAELKIQEIQLAAIIRSKKIRREQVKQAIQAIEAIHGRLLRNQIFTHLDIHEILTPKQRAMVSKMHSPPPPDGRFNPLP